MVQASIVGNIAQGIKHFEMYTGYCLTIEKSKMGKYHQYGCRVHKNCPFCESFGYEHGSIVITMKNKNFIHSGIGKYTTTKDGRKRKKRCKGQLDQLFNLFSLTHDDNSKPSDLKKTAAAHDGLIAGYNTAWRMMKAVHTTWTTAASKTFELIIPYL